jgi:hypothetical protein
MLADYARNEEILAVVRSAWQQSTARRRFSPQSYAQKGAAWPERSLMVRAAPGKISARMSSTLMRIVFSCTRDKASPS